VTTFWVVTSLVALLLVVVGVAYYYRGGTEGRRRAAIEQDRLFCQQRLMYLTQLTMAAMRAAARQHGRDDA
jgi:hypothetical protein